MRPVPLPDGPLPDLASAVRRLHTASTRPPTTASSAAGGCAGSPAGGTAPSSRPTWTGTACASSSTASTSAIAPSGSGGPCGCWHDAPRAWPRFRACTTLARRGRSSSWGCCPGATSAGASAGNGWGARRDPCRAAPDHPGTAGLRLQPAIGQPAALLPGPPRTSPARPPNQQLDRVTTLLARP